jgi:UDP-glucose 4-epimerase
MPDSTSPVARALPAGTILVTGAAGYIASHTCIELLGAGYDVVGIDNFDNSSPGALDAIADVAGRRIDFVEGDVADAGVVDGLLSRHRVDAVIHFTGLKAVNESVHDPLRYYRVNLGTSLTLVEQMRRHGVRTLVFSSSCTVYGDPTRLPIDESSPLRPVNPYGQTKLAIEQLLRDVAASDPAWRIMLLRYFNPVGAHPSGRLGEDPRGVPNCLMPYVMQVAVGRRETVSVFGGDYDTADGTCVRDFIHVVDLALGHLAALRALDAGDESCRVYNLGTGTGTSVLEMLAAASAAVGRPVPYQVVGRRAGDAPVVYADPSRANAELGWRATRTIAEMCADQWRWQSTHPYGFAEPAAHVAR